MEKLFWIVILLFYDATVINVFGQINADFLSKRDFIQKH